MKSRPLLIALAFVALATACGGNGDESSAEDLETALDANGTSPTTEVPASSLPLECDDEVVVGVVTDMSGGLALIGHQIWQGVAIGFAHAAGETASSSAEQSHTVDGCEIRILSRDDQSNPQLTAVMAGELVDEGASILIGSASPATTSVLRQIADERGVVLLAATDTTLGLAGEDFSPNAFLLGPTVYQDAMAICGFLVEVQAVASFAQIAPDYAYGHRAAHAYRDACTHAGATSVAPDVIAPTNPDDGFVEYLEPLVDRNPDVLLVTWSGGGLVDLTRTASELLDPGTGLATRLLPNPLTKALLFEAVGSTSSIAYHYTVPGNAINDVLIEQTGTVFEANPDLYDAAGMNAALMAIAGLRAAGGVESQLSSGLEGLEFVGPKGEVTIRPEDHVAVQDMFVVTLLNIDDPDEAYYEYLATVRPEPPCMLVGEFADRCGNLPAGSLGG